MASRLTAKFAALGTSTVLAAAALVAASGAANADSSTVSNATPLTYACSLVTGGTVNVAATFSVPSTVSEGAGAAAIPASLSAVLDADSVATLDSALKTLGQSSFDGSFTGGFGYTGGGNSSLDGTFTIPTTQAPPTGSPYTLPVTGTIAAPTAGSGTASIYAPAALSLNVTVGGAPFPIGCPLAPSTQDTKIGDVTVNPADLSNATFTGKASGEKIMVAATTDGTTAGSGSVSYSFTGKVAHVKTVKKGKKKVKKTTYVSKKFKGTAALNGAGKATINLAKDKLAKGKYKVTLTWAGQTTTVTVKAAK